MRSLHSQGLATDLLYGLDAARWAQEALGFELDPWQRDFLRSTSKRLILNCSRQSGKSTVSAVLALWTAIYRPCSLILCLSPSLRQSSELFRKITDMYHRCSPDIETTEESALRLALENGSRILSLPGKEQTVRGFSAVSLLVVDEAARVPDDLYYSIRPMLAVSGGRLVTISTPFGTRGWWYEACMEAISSRDAGGPGTWDYYEIPATMCPRISPEFLEEERRTLGSYWFEQEYLCKFLDANTQVFRREDIDAMFAEQVVAWCL